MSRFGGIGMLIGLLISPFIVLTVVLLSFPSQSLVATIRQHRKDLLQDHAFSSPAFATTPPSQFAEKYNLMSMWRRDREGEKREEEGDV